MFHWVPASNSYVRHRNTPNRDEGDLVPTLSLDLPLPQDLCNLIEEFVGDSLEKVNVYHPLFDKWVNNPGLVVIYRPLPEVDAIDPDWEEKLAYEVYLEQETGWASLV